MALKPRAPKPSEELGLPSQLLNGNRGFSAIEAPMALNAFSRWKVPALTSIFLRFLYRTPISDLSLLAKPQAPAYEIDSLKSTCGFRRLYHDGRPRGPLWRGKKLIGKEALFVIQGLKRFKDDEEKLDKLIRTHVLRLLKLDMIAVLVELERQEEVTLAIKVRSSSRPMLESIIYQILVLGFLMTISSF